LGFAAAVAHVGHEDDGEEEADCVGGGAEGAGRRVSECLSGGRKEEKKSGLTRISRQSPRS
jgi:hypothetical protein